DRVLPSEELLDRQRITAAGFLERQQTPTHGRDNFGLASDNPALGPRRGQIRDRERATVRPDHILDPRAVGFSHGYSHTHWTDYRTLEIYPPWLKICLSAAANQRRPYNLRGRASSAGPRRAARR